MAPAGLLRNRGGGVCATFFFTYAVCDYLPRFLRTGERRGIPPHAPLDLTPGLRPNRRRHRADSSSNHG